MLVRHSELRLASDMALVELPAYIGSGGAIAKRINPKLDPLPVSRGNGLRIVSVPRGPSPEELAELLTAAAQDSSTRSHAKRVRVDGSVSQRMIDK